MITQTYVQWVHISRDRDGMIIQTYVQWVHISRDRDGMITQTYVIGNRCSFIVCYTYTQKYRQLKKKERRGSTLLTYILLNWIAYCL